MKKNPVCVIYWRDAAYFSGEKAPENNPPVQLTAGFIVEATDDYTNISTNVNYNLKTGELNPVDGFVLPNKTTLNFKKMGNLNEDE